MLTKARRDNRRAELFCDQCQGYVRVLAGPDHLKRHPDHTMRLRWYPPKKTRNQQRQ